MPSSNNWHSRPVRGKCPAATTLACRRFTISIRTCSRERKTRDRQVSKRAVLSAELSDPREVAGHQQLSQRRLRLQIQLGVEVSPVRGAHHAEIGAIFLRR